MAFDPARAKALFLEASDLAAPDRAAFLDRECDGNAGLRARVSSLLAADVAPRPAPGPRAPRSEAATGPAAEGAGAVLGGKYRLVELIGEGGMGSVWLAQQSEPVKRKVAVKIIKLGMDSRQVLGRFDVERQALAMMDHPNIAKVLDAGLAPDGRPFFVMELVRGTPITEFCDANRLGVRERLDLFVQVCQAIQHAHQKGIIHRDVKPSNVLIALYDERPVPKVIDFGVAKATGEVLTEGTLGTAFGGIVGTPHYMSPEQATLDNLDVDTRSDVYSLGVLLYELLAGSPPFSEGELEKRGMVEVLRVVREAEPPRPSTKLSRAAELPSLSANRGAEPRKLTALLRDELDWIVLRSLEKNRARRYDTANGLAADVQRYLAGEPVLAHPPTTLYRLGKFARRHRGQVVAASVVAAALVLGLAGTAWQARRASRERDLALAAKASEAGQREAAESERDRAERIAGFMSEILGGAGPSVARGRDIAMLREMMDGAAARIERGELRNAPGAEFRLRRTIGDTYLQLGLPEEAGKMLGPAVALGRSLYPDGNAETVRNLNALAFMWMGRGDLAKAQQLQEEALATQRRLSRPGDAGLAVTLSNAAQILRVRGDLAGAEKLYREALAAWAALPGDAVSRVDCEDGLSETLRLRGDLGGAETLARDALAEGRRLFPGDDPCVFDSLNTLANALRARGKLAEAERLARAQLGMGERLYPGDHPKVANALNNLAFTLHGLGDRTAPEPMLREALAMFRRLSRDDSANEAFCICNLASVLADQGKPAEAEPLFRESLEMRRRLYHGDNPDVQNSLIGLAAALYSRGDLAGAEPLYRESIEVAKRLEPGDTARLAGLLSRLGYVLQARGDLEGAEPVFRESLEVTRRLSPGDSMAVATALANIAVLHRRRGDLAGSERSYREALAMMERLFPEGHPGVAFVLGNLSSVLRERGDLAGAEPPARRALAAKRRLYPGDNADVAEALSDLASLLLARGDAAGAEPPAREGLAMSERLGGKHRVLAAEFRLTLGGALARLGRFPEGEAELLAAERVSATAKEASPDQHARSVAALVDLYESWQRSDPAKGYGAKATEWKAKLPDKGNAR